jgi:hypothetical protein
MYLLTTEKVVYQTIFSSNSDKTPSFRKEALFPNQNNNYSAFENK